MELINYKPSQHDIDHLRNLLTEFDKMSEKSKIEQARNFIIKLEKYKKIADLLGDKILEDHDFIKNLVEKLKKYEEVNVEQEKKFIALLNHERTSSEKIEKLVTIFSERQKELDQ